MNQQIDLSTSSQYLTKLRPADQTQFYNHLRDEYYTDLLSFAESLLKSRELAEEVISDVLFYMWQRKDALEHVLHLRLYLFTAVRNRCYRHLLRIKREQELFVTGDAAHESLSDGVATDPENLMITSELSLLITRTVESLPPRCKLIYQLIREQGQRNKDVAIQLNISVNTIDVQLALALKKIGNAIRLYMN